MSYPKNKRERLLIGKKKGFKRISLWCPEKDKEKAGRYKDVTKKCSALWCCGNPRRKGELKFQERRFLDSLKD